MCLSLVACDELSGLIETVPTSGPPTKSEIASGIREALIVGTQNTVSQTSAKNGFYKNPKIKIPFPPEAEKVAKTAREIGMGSQVDSVH
ncbi:MAG: DUF4197 family protein [Owenweeksia sp.]|nr:DUF4197 family protein [Owenweeksia sp.]